ncbi:MAG: fumarate reductase flavoprotein subunit [Desulfovibrionaceae bacterium]|nr:fumarate reductase flavoprotein subunit [Desulfovibrionaceae bacterium]
MQTWYSDLLVIGAGLSGERAAVEAAEKGFSVVVLSIVPARRSHSSAAQGGMQAALGNSVMGEGDSPDVHFADTVKGSDWGCDQEVARLFADAAPIEMRRLAAWGVPWNRVVAGKDSYFKGGEKFEKEEKKENEGLITARSFGGTAKWRTCYTSDGTGHAVMCTMDNRCAELGINVLDRKEAVALIHDGTTCTGAVVRCIRTGALEIFRSRATVIATGGFGRLYKATTNAVICDGMGHIIALDTGLVPVGNPEAIQFHPTGIVPTDILVTEGCRGDGGTLLDVDQKRFMQIYEPEKAELASRDVVSRRMIEHMRSGKGVSSPYGEHLWLDIRHLGDQHICAKLREVDEICKYFLGVDPRAQLIPVRPTQHYTMAGIRTNKDGAAYGLKGLFSVGEAACWDMHGFNRLGGNSLAETVVAGGIVGLKIAEFLQGHETVFGTAAAREAVARVEQKIDELAQGSKGKESVYAVRAELQQALMDGCFVFRNEQGLLRCIETLQGTLERARKVGLAGGATGVAPELSAALRIEGQVKLGLMIAKAALERRESRGSHNREDYPARDDKNGLTRTLAYWRDGADMPELAYEDASPVFELPPGERGYGGGQIVPADPDMVAARMIRKG